VAIDTELAGKSIWIGRESALTVLEALS